MQNSSAHFAQKYYRYKIKETKSQKNGMQRRVKAVCGRLKNVTATTTAHSGKWKGAATTSWLAGKCRGCTREFSIFSIYSFYRWTNIYLPFSFICFSCRRLLPLKCLCWRMRKVLHVLRRSLTHLHAIMNWYFFCFFYFFLTQRS